MPERKTTRRAQAKKGKAPSTQAGEYVREEIKHVRQAKHGARSAKQAIAIGLSKARRAGVKLPPQPGKKATKANSRKPNPKRSRAIKGVLKREGRAGASHRALSRQARGSAQRRGSASRSMAARKAARTRARRAA